MDNLIENIDRLHTTELGAKRIKRNLQIGIDHIDDIVQWCKMRILDQDAVIERIGKNWYITINHYKITVNAQRYTIITAHYN